MMLNRVKQVAQPVLKIHRSLLLSFEIDTLLNKFCSTHELFNSIPVKKIILTKHLIGFSEFQEITKYKYNLTPNDYYSPISNDNEYGIRDLCLNDKYDKIYVLKDLATNYKVIHFDHEYESIQFSDNLQIINTQNIKEKLFLD